ncbi:MAG: DUF2157 domain-containing protein [Cyanomargarita calcarea GSE-NOS-MK-12-04C]|jgi:energy-converting hydrogenase Eha subunit A|uniref:DUF2157 domain-containing protein n=1 Tax=Cyanomargarita calcarea GSE-NOS-MK-12-04C TaxID=2839659 RepID=A0A951QSE3_9CYAN|nr:DUF2157 domain-containing protein [Cyanomargarita calcarea GSE-NOS-MK-12-04C]
MSSDRPSNIQVRLPSSHPELLQGLDILLNLGLISDTQVRQICRENLVSRLVLEPQKTTVYSEAVEELAPQFIINDQRNNTQKEPTAPSFATTMLQSLGAELSVRWLLFLGVFLVVVSSGVLAASQWQRFPASGQYSVLFAYTLSFWGFSFWAGKQPNLKLTARTLLIVTLLLVPVNFWAMDSFGLWRNPLDWIVVAIASVVLTAVTILLCNNRLFVANLPKGKLPLINILLLCYLHWGWQLPGFSLISVYLAMVGTTIATIYHARLQQPIPTETENQRTALGISLPTSIIVYGLGVLLVRAIFVVRVDVTELGLAIGICGWLLGWLGQNLWKDKETGGQGENVASSPLSPPPPLEFPWQSIGGVLLFLGWLVSVIPHPWQALCVSVLSLWFFGSRLQRYTLKRDFTAIFLIGLQAVWLGWRLIPFELQKSIVTTATQLTNSQNEPWALLSISLFPYIIVMVALTDRLHRRGKRELAKFGETLTLSFGACLTTIALVNPTLRSLNLLLDTITLAIVTYRENQRGQGENFTAPLIYLTHITGVITLFSWVNLLFPSLSNEIWAVISLALMVVEWVFSVGNGIWRRSAWHIGFGLATISFCLLLINSQSSWLTYITPSPCVLGGSKCTQGNWGLIWLITPLTLTAIASRSATPQRTTNSSFSLLTLICAQFLILPLPKLRLIGLAAAAILMFANTRYLQTQESALLTVGFGLSFIAGIFWESHLSLAGWFVANAIAILGLWLIQKTLTQRNHELSTLYAAAIDKWAIALCSFELFSLTLHSVLVFQQITKPEILNVISTAIVLTAIAFRGWQLPTNVAFYGVGLCLELLAAQFLSFGEHSIIKIAIANIALGLIAQLSGEWWRRRHNLETLPNRWHVLPLIYGIFGAVLRTGTFSNWTGLSSLAVALIIIGVGRRQQNLKPLLYLGIIGLSVSAYELLLYQMLQASGGAIGDGLIAMSALGAGIMYSYRVLAPWLVVYLRLSAKELTAIAHFHWLWSSCLLMAATTSPVQVNQYLALTTGAFLIRYAIFQGRSSQLPDPGKVPEIPIDELWVYLGLLQTGVVSFFLQNMPVGRLFNGVLLPWQSALACVVAYFLYILPWERWGWSKTPWQRTAYILPLIFVWLTSAVVYPITLLIVACFYIFLAKSHRNIRFTYISIVLIDWACWRWLYQLHITDTLWYASLIGMSLLYVAQLDTGLRQPESKATRHSLRLIGAGLICGWAIIFNQPIIPGILSLIAIFAGLALRVRAFLYVGTASFFITSIYQLVIFCLRYPFLKWVVGLVVGILLISVAANFETRRTQLNSLLRNQGNGFQDWE